MAGASNAAEIGLITHVVGFGLTPEQREAIRCIAEEGGGELFAAADAESLSEAVFSALRQLEPTVAGYVGGNAFGLLGAGEPGELAVVAIGPYQNGLGLPLSSGTIPATMARASRSRPSPATPTAASSVRGPRSASIPTLSTAGPPSAGSTSAPAICRTPPPTKTSRSTPRRAATSPSTST